MTPLGKDRAKRRTVNGVLAAAQGWIGASCDQEPSGLHREITFPVLVPNSYKCGARDDGLSCGNEAVSSGRLGFTLLKRFHAGPICDR